MSKRRLDLTYCMILDAIKELEDKKQKVTNQKISSITGFTEARVCNWLQDLKEAGYVKIVKGVMNPKENNITLKAKGNIKLTMFNIENSVNRVEADDLDRAIYGVVKGTYNKVKNLIDKKGRGEELNEEEN